MWPQQKYIVWLNFSYMLIYCSFTSPHNYNFYAYNDFFLKFFCIPISKGPITYGKAEPYLICWCTPHNTSLHLQHTVHYKTLDVL
jgi:hypothetical protein